MTKNEREITLGLLNAVHDNHRVTQRSVAKELGVALGLVNAYLKRCIKKGYIKVRMAPANRYAYYLTPAGFVEKSRLTAEYLSQSFNFFRRARKECSKILAHCVGRGWRRVALAGASDLGEQTLDHVEPEGGGGCEVNVEAGMLAEPPLHRRRLVGAVMVGDEM